MHQLSAKQLRDQFLSGEVKAEEITTAFLERIEKYNPQFGAFLTVLNDSALAQAKHLDRKRERGEPCGHLAGIPVAIKDNIHIQGEMTTCASKFLTNFRAPFEATAVRLIRESGGVFIGKTNLDEFAMGSSTENSALQQTRNPWNTNCIPGGSSGGSAAAVAARLTPLALGSDTGGSIRQPAALTGTVGFKPTYGRVSRFGLVAFGSSLDQIGPFANRTEDIALIMEVLGQHCKKDSTSVPLPPDDYLGQLDKGIAGMKIGVPWSFLEKLDAAPKEHFTQSLETLKSLGAEIVDINLDLLKYSIAIYYILATAEASTNLARFDGIRYGVRSPNAKTLNEVYDLSKEEGFGHEVKRRILLGTFVLSTGYQDAYYRQAQKVRTLMIRQFQEAFEKCALIALPTTPSTAFEMGSVQTPLQMYLEDVYTICSNLCGVPAISVPSGLAQKELPMGLQIMGPQKHDPLVIQAAHAFEGATKFTSQPQGVS